jgi:hypothetical protein
MKNELIRMFDLNPMLRYEFLDTHESLPYFLRMWIQIKVRFIKLFKQT